MLRTTLLPNARQPEPFRRTSRRRPSHRGRSTELRSRGRARVLTPGRDYIIDAAQETIRLAAPLWRFDDDFEPVVLTVTYAPADAQRSQLAAGAGYEIRSPEGWYAGIGILQNETFPGRMLAGIDTKRATFEAAYTVGTEEGASPSREARVTTPSPAPSASTTIPPITIFEDTPKHELPWRNAPA